MNCPTCADTTLVMTERSGVEIDYCPSCRGVWLDRGELDKIIERSAPDTAQPRRRDGWNDRARRPDHDDPHRLPGRTRANAHGRGWTSLDS